MVLKQGKQVESRWRCAEEVMILICGKPDVKLGKL
jgi:hypothetical protein